MIGFLVRTGHRFLQIIGGTAEQRRYAATEENLSLFYEVVAYSAWRARFWELFWTF